MPNKSLQTITHANFSPDSKQIISASGDNNLKLWDLAGNCLQTFVGHTYIGIVFSANFSPDGICTCNPSRMPNKSLQTITR
jgi:WD40 repeat protein